MSLVKGLARPVPDFARLHALEEQRVARWKRQHKKELTGPCNVPCAAHAFVRRRHPAQALSSVADSRYACGCLAVPKGFKLNPAPPDAGKTGARPPVRAGEGTQVDNEWLSDREREQERLERLAIATRADAELKQQQHQHNAGVARPSTAAARRPEDQKGGRPYSAKPASRDSPHMHSPYATRTSSGGGGGGGGGSGGAAPVTIQAYANSMANRSPIRDESGAQGVQSQARTGTGSKFADKLAERVKVAAAALEEDQLASGMPLRIAAPCRP